MDLRTRRELTALRLTAQRIASPPASNAADTVRFMLALQAQDFAGARWSVGLRTPGATDADVLEAIATGRIVRSWPMRGTLHLVAAEDFLWMLRLTRHRQATVAATRRRELGIADMQLAAAGDIAVAVASGGRTVRRDALLAEFERAGIPTDGQRGYHLLWNLAHDGLIVFGPPDGAQPTFALLEEWIPSSRQLEGDEALEELARRYVASHGPATDRDLAWWSSLTLSDARRALELAGAAWIERDGIRYFMPEGIEPARRGIHLLPGFDEFVLGYQDRSAPLPDEFASRIVPGGNGVFRSTIVAGGLIVGTWRRTTLSGATLIELEAFTELSTAARAGAEVAARRLGRYLGSPVVTRSSIDTSRSSD